MSKLEPCPFCKKAMDTDYSLKAGDPTRVICWQCGAEAELSEWNKRPIEDALQARIDELTAYADRLAEGLPEGMLPKDIELIRDANWKMAEELFQLRSRIKVAREEIVEAVTMYKDTYAVGGQIALEIFDKHLKEVE